MGMTVDDLLIEARGVLPHRPGPAGALAAQSAGALLVDIRGDDQRRADGLVPGAPCAAPQLAGVTLRSRVTVAAPGDQPLDPAAPPDLRRGLSVQSGGGHLAQARPGQCHRSGRGLCRVGCGQLGAGGADTHITRIRMTHIEDVHCLAAAPNERMCASRGRGSITMRSQKHRVTWENPAAGSGVLLFKRETAGP